MRSYETLGTMKAEHSLCQEGYRIEEYGRIISNVVFMGMGEPLTNLNTMLSKR
ncbi:MAG: hypothetical protein R3E08_12610 [Thiotrichaceae bacterium]